MIWYKKKTYTVLKPPEKKDRIPDGLWHKCPTCLNIILKKDYDNGLKVCAKCKYHDKLNAIERLAITVDSGTFEEWDKNLKSVDPLNFVDSKKYPDRLKAVTSSTGLNEAVIIGKGKINGYEAALGVMDFRFIGGSMGSCTGEKVTRMMEKALELKIPAITISTSGGARMQEGILSLMQMAKTSIACAKLKENGIPYISVLTNPTTAGVMASFASLGDIIIAEPDALIGFAGPRVIEQTINQILPKGFQRSEFVLQHGFIDIIVERADLKNTLSNLLRLLYYA